MDINSELDSYFYEHIVDNLDGSMVWNLHSYTIFDYKAINKYLLGSKVSLKRQYKLDNKIAILRSAIKRSPLHIPITVYHGTNTSLLNNVSLDEYLSKTNKITIKTFLSTTTSEAIAADFCGFQPRNSMVLEIKLPENYPAIWLGRLSLHHDENELLLLNNIHLEINDVENKKYHKLVHTKLL